MSTMEAGDTIKDESMSNLTSIEEEINEKSQCDDINEENDDDYEENSDEMKDNQPSNVVALISHTQQVSNEKISNLNAQGYYLIPLPKGKSLIWQYFGLCSKDGVTILPEHSGTVFCLVNGCSAPEIGYCGNTTNLYGHLARKHPEIELPRKRNEKNLDETEFQPIQNHNKKTVVRLNRLELSDSPRNCKKRGRPNGRKDSYKRQKGANDSNDFDDNFEVLEDLDTEQDFEESDVLKYDVIPITTPNKTTTTKPSDKIYEHLVDYSVKDLVGSDMVTKDGFQSLLKILSPDLNDNFTFNLDIFNNMLKAKYRKCQADFKLSLIQDQIEVFSLLLEEWVSRWCITYLEVRVCYLDARWKIRNQVLGNLSTNTNHTNWKFTTERIKRLLNEMNVSVFNGGNKELVSSTSSMMNFENNCSFLGVVSIPSFETVLCVALQDALSEGVCGSLLEKINFNVKNMKILEVYQAVTNRLEEVLKQESIGVANPNQKTSLSLKLSTKQWIEIKELRCELDKVDNFLSVMNEMNHIPISMLIPLRYKFLEIIKPYNNDSHLAQSFKRIMTDKIESYYSEAETIILLEKSMWLDPRFKNLALMNNKENVEQQIMEEITYLKPPRKTTQNGHLDSYSSLERLFESLPTEGEADANLSTQAQEEIQRYNRCASTNFKADPMEWWRNMSPILPYLSQLAKKYLTIPINSSNFALRKSRSVLNIEDLAHLPFLNSFCNKT